MTNQHSEDTRSKLADCGCTLTYGKDGVTIVSREIGNFRCANLLQLILLDDYRDSMLRLGFSESLVAMIQEEARALLQRDIDESYP